MENNESNAILAESMGYKLVDDAEKKESTESVKTENVETESSLKESSDTPESSESKSETVDFDTLLREKSGGKFKSYSDLEKSLQVKEAPTPKTETFANEKMAKLNQYILDGGTLEDFNKTQIDYSEMSDIDIIKSEMKLNDSELSDDDIDFMINKDYQLDEEEYEEDEVRISKIKLRKDAKLAREKMTEWQEQYKIPENQQNTQTQKKVSNEESRQKSEAQLREKERWENLVNETTSKLKEVKFDINDKGEKFTFSLSDEDRNTVKSSSSDLSKFWSRFMNDDGTENVEKLNKTMFIIDNFDRIVRAVANQYKSNGKDDVLKDIKNPDFNAGNTTVSDSSPKSLQQQMYDAWKKDN
tara:strand:- start:1013 stop:2083 length:1071 start_codon:yes stop_codon:yes gene_type:complete